MDLIINGAYWTRQPTYFRHIQEQPCVIYQCAIRVVRTEWRVIPGEILLCIGRIVIIINLLQHRKMRYYGLIGNGYVEDGERMKL